MFTWFRVGFGMVIGWEFGKAVFTVAAKVTEKLLEENCESYRQWEIEHGYRSASDFEEKNEEA